MQKPNDYDQTKERGSYTPVELGGHYLVIKQVSEKKNKNGGDMIVIMFDFAPEDAQAAYFMNQYKNDTRSDKKWPNQATVYMNVFGRDGKTSQDFKTFCTCTEHSNNGFSAWNGAAFNAAGFKNRKVGAVFGEQMDFYNGEEKKKRVLRWFISCDKVPEATVPKESATKAWKDWQKDGGSATAGLEPGTQAFDDFMNVSESEMDELPFN